MHTRSLKKNPDEEYWCSGDETDYWPDGPLWQFAVRSDRELWDVCEGVGAYPNTMGARLYVVIDQATSQALLRKDSP